VTHSLDATPRLSAPRLPSLRSRGADAFADEVAPRRVPRAAVSFSPAMSRFIGVAIPASCGAVFAASAWSTRVDGALAIDPLTVAVVPAVAACVLGLPLALARVLGKRTAPVDAQGSLGVVVAALAVGVAVAGAASPFFALMLAAVAALGAVIPGRRLAAMLPVCAACAAAALVHANEDAGAVVADALVVLGFGMLGRALFFGTLKAVKMREEARVDGELLRLYDDARMFGLLGASEEGDEGAAEKRLVAQTLAVRDGCYRLLRLGARALRPDAAALYLVDKSGKELVLKEQLLDVDGAVIEKISASAGALGLAVKRAQAIRLLDVDGPAVQVHRRGAKSVLCAPLRDGQALRGVLVFDRNRAELFSDDDETFALALCEELVALLRTERVLERLDVEHKKIARIFHAGRAFGGVVHVEEAMAHTLAAAIDLAPHASAAVVEVVQGTLFVRRCAGPDAAALACEDAVALDDGAWVARAILQRTALPHVALEDADRSLERGLYATGDGRVKNVGDLRVIPLFAQGEAVACLVVVTPKGERLKSAVVDGLLAAADLAGIAIGGARLFETVERQATTDGLTGLVNRRTLDTKLDEAVVRAGRLQTPLCAILVDVDHFKSVNDTYGHGSGDDVLRGIARALAQTARTSDVVARYGGEELCIVLEGCDVAGASRLAERMRLAIKALRFDTEKGPLSVTASFGVAELRGGDDARAILERADGGLYKAKHSGRDRVVVG
jgi:diguanylate cyclase (GGDEF)-like protein